MYVRERSIGVSPIIATLLLVAITVAAGIIVYVFVSGYTSTLTQGGGQQTAQQIELTAYNFVNITAASTETCNSNTTMTVPCMTIALKNTGGAAVTIDSIYFDGLALTPAGTLSSTTHITIASQANAVVLLVKSGTFTTNKGGFTGLPVVTGGSTHTLKMVTTTGALFSYTVTAGAAA
jgi:flagellin-like protein